MHWAGGITYAAAAVFSLVDGRPPTIAIIAICLGVWLFVAVAVEDRATPVLVKPDGWTGAMTTRATDTITAMRAVAFYAAWLRLSLIFFSFLLMSWTLLP